MNSTGRLSDIKAMTPDQLDAEVLNLKKEQFNLRFQRATGQLENSALHASALEEDGAAIEELPCP